VYRRDVEDQRIESGATISLGSADHHPHTVDGPRLFEPDILLDACARPHDSSQQPAIRIACQYRHDTSEPERGICSAYLGGVRQTTLCGLAPPAWAAYAPHDQRDGTDEQKR
jgi:hypothetical protein